MFKPASDAHDRNPTYLEGLRLVNGNPLFSPKDQQWIRSRTGSTISSNLIDKYRLPYLCSTRPPLANDNHKILKLPDRQIVEELAARFCSSTQSLVFPLLSLQRFTTITLPLAYASVHKRHVTSAKCCAYGVLIMSDIFGLDPGDTMADISCWCQRYALEIEGSMPTILREMRVDGLESLMMLVSSFFNLTSRPLTSDRADDFQILHGRFRIRIVPRFSDLALLDSTWSPSISLLSGTLR
jgi:hypothetical protein